MGVPAVYFCLAWNGRPARLSPQSMRYREPTGQDGGGWRLVGLLTEDLLETCILTAIVQARVATDRVKKVMTRVVQRKRARQRRDRRVAILLRAFHHAETVPGSL